MWEVAKGIPRLQSRRTVRTLLDILQSATTDQEHRVAAAYALGFSFDSRAVAPLSRILGDRVQGARLRGYVAEALGYLGDVTAVGALIRALSDPSAEVRYWAAFALGQIGDRRALPRLRKLAASDTGRIPQFGSVRDEAAAAIDHIKNTKSESR
jgi:HEAT repeat protein